MRASNHSYRLYGVDLLDLMCRATLVNAWLYAPWLAKPFPFWPEPEKPYAPKEETRPDGSIRRVLQTPPVVRRRTQTAPDPNQMEIVLTP